MNRKSSVRKRIIAITISLSLLAGTLLGIQLYMSIQRDKKSVEVIPVSSIVTQYTSITQTSQGQATSEYFQEIFQDSSKVISEILVKEGDTVTIGTPLLQYDKEKLTMDVERKQLDIKSTENEINLAQKQLKKLQNTTPTTPAPPVVITPAPPVILPTYPPVIPSTPRPSTPTPPTPKPELTPSPTPSPTPEPTPEPTPTPTPSPSPVPPSDVTLYYTIEPDAEPYGGNGSSENPYRFLCAPGCSISAGFLRQLLGQDPREDPADPSQTITAPFAAVFEVRDGNSNYGRLLHAYIQDGISLSSSIVIGDEANTAATQTNYSTIDLPFAQIPATPHTSRVQALSVGLQLMQLTTAATPTPTPKPSTNTDNYNSMGYSSSELKQLIEEKKKEIAETQFSLKQKKIDLDRANLALKNSTVLSTVDGVVKSLLPLDVATAESKPFLTISGDTKFYVRGTISESDLASVQVGTEITASSWDTGGTYTCQIVSINDYPVEDDASKNFGFGEANQNNSRYEFLAVIEGGDDLTNGMWLEINFQVESEEDKEAIFVDKMYVREDDGGFYVLKKGPDMRIMKQYVKAGRLIYSASYIEIKSGLTLEDEVAFPYGKDVWIGIKTRPFGAEVGEEYEVTKTESNSETSLISGESYIPIESLPSLPPDIVNGEESYSNSIPDGFSKQIMPDEKAVG